MESLQFNKQDAMELIAGVVNLLSELCAKRAIDAGWHKKLEDATRPLTYNHNICNYVNSMFISQNLMLMVSEISEAMEGHRKGLMDDKLPHRKMMEVELADCIIRICHIAGYMNMDLGGAIIEKMEYNLHREDHKVENREKEGGKRY